MKCIKITIVLCIIVTNRILYLRTNKKLTQFNLIEESETRLSNVSAF